MKPGVLFVTPHLQDADLLSPGGQRDRVPVDRGRQRDLAAGADRLAEYPAGGVALQLAEQVGQDGLVEVCRRGVLRLRPRRIVSQHARQSHQSRPHRLRR